jgi:SAM-dependent methyltransferase
MRIGRSAAGVASLGALRLCCDSTPLSQALTPVVLIKLMPRGSHVTPSVDPPSAEFSYESIELDALAQAHNYYRWILESFRPHLGRHVVEVGAGVGTFSELLVRESGAEAFSLFEPAQNNFPKLRARFAHDPRVSVHHSYFEDGALPSRSADSIVLVNVLEHIEGDRAFMATASRALRPGGALLIFVPALPALFGSLDSAFGHYRRYTKRVLDARLREAGFRDVHLRYVNIAGILPWFITGKLLRRRTIDPAAVRFYDRMVIPWLFALEGQFEPPLGQNILAVAKT